MNRDEVQSLVAETLAKAAGIYERPFSQPDLRFDIQGGRAGEARLGELRFNPTWLEEPDFDETVVHECAHLVSRILYPASRSHGDEWKAVMLALGVQPERTHHYDMGQLAGRHPYWCDCKQYHVSDRMHNQMLAGQKRHCTKCKANLRPGLKPTEPTEWKQQQCALCQNLIPAPGKQLSDYPKWGSGIGYACYEHRGWKLRISGKMLFRVSPKGAILQHIKNME